MKNKALTFDYDRFDIERPFDFSSHSSMGCGGKASLAFYPKTEEEFVFLVKKLGADCVVVGNLTNVLVSDLGTDKIVICTKKLRQIQAVDERSVYAESGVMSHALLAWLRASNLGGAEFLTGIPCTLGGALYMNAGAGGRYSAELVQTVRICRDGEVLTIPVEDCEYGYKHSLFMESGDVILGATLRLQRSDIRTIADAERYYREKRRHLPKGRSLGCIFKNPTEGSAGEWIERAGLKGLRVGGAKVSELHANFIINDANATTKEIRTLIELIKNAVFSSCGVVLEEEIRYIDEKCID